MSLIRYIIESIDNPGHPPERYTDPLIVELNIEDPIEVRFIRQLDMFIEDFRAKQFYDRNPTGIYNPSQIRYIELPFTMPIIARYFIILGRDNKYQYPLASISNDIMSRIVRLTCAAIVDNYVNMDEHTSSLWDMYTTYESEDPMFREQFYQYLTEMFGTSQDPLTVEIEETFHRNGGSVPPNFTLTPYSAGEHSLASSIVDTFGL